MSIRALLNKSIFRHACGNRMMLVLRGGVRRDGRLQGVEDRMKLSPRRSKLVGLALANTSKQINRKPHSTAYARPLSQLGQDSQEAEKFINYVRSHTCLEWK